MSLCTSTTGNIHIEFHNTTTTDNTLLRVRSPATHDDWRDVYRFPQPPSSSNRYGCVVTVASNTNLIVLFWTYTAEESLPIIERSSLMRLDLTWRDDEWMVTPPRPYDVGRSRPMFTIRPVPLFNSVNGPVTERDVLIVYHFRDQLSADLYDIEAAQGRPIPYQAWMSQR